MDNTFVIDGEDWITDYEAIDYVVERMKDQGWSRDDAERWLEELKERRPDIWMQMGTA